LRSTDGGCQVVDADVAGHIRPPDAELTWRPERMAKRLAGLEPEGGATAARGRQARPIPELDRKRTVGKNALDLSAKRCSAGHAPDDNERA
jgi:hypothetical protein